MPDLGQQAVVDSVFPSPGDQPADLSARQAPQLPALPPSQQDPNAGVNPGEQAPTAPQKGGLWRQVLAGALQGLAAGSAVNTKGMGGAGAFAAGAGAGANQVLNVVPQQEQQLNTAELQNAFHHAQLAQIQREMALAPKDKHEQYLQNASDTFQSMLKSGGVQPLSAPTDFATAQQAYQAATLKNPALSYSIMPTGRDEDGEFQYSAVLFPNGVTTADQTLTDPDGNKLVVPAGTKANQVGQHYTNLVTKALERDSKESIAGQNNVTKVATNAATNATKVQTAGISAAAAAQRASGQNVVAWDPEYQNIDGSKGANVVLDKGTAQQRGLFNYKADPSGINSLAGGMNDVQNKLNALADVVNDTNRMKQVQPELAAAMLNPNTGVTLSFGGHGGGASGGIGVATDRINAWLNNANVKDASQATKDFVAATLASHEAVTNLPRLQTFGKSNRMTHEQMLAAVNLLPSPGDTPSFAQQKMENLQTMIDPLRKQIPHMPGAELIPSWLEQKQKAPVATHTHDPFSGVLNLINNGGGQ
jgi:hypothetical protein